MKALAERRALAERAKAALDIRDEIPGEPYEITISAGYIGKMFQASLTSERQGLVNAIRDIPDVDLVMRN